MNVIIELTSAERLAGIPERGEDGYDLPSPWLPLETQAAIREYRIS